MGGADLVTEPFQVKGELHRKAGISVKAACPTHTAEQSMKTLLEDVVFPCKSFRRTGGMRSHRWISDLQHHTKSSAGCQLPNSLPVPSDQSPGSGTTARPFLIHWGGAQMSSAPTLGRMTKSPRTECGPASSLHLHSAR